MIGFDGNPSSFRAEAQFQRVCAACRAPGAFDAHHVVAKQVLKRNGHRTLLWHPHNALRLCTVNRCHERYTGRALQIDTAMLLDHNICFIWRTLGMAGHNYLDRQYTGVDRRFTVHEEGTCPLCQDRQGF